MRIHWYGHKLTSNAFHRPTLRAPFTQIHLLSSLKLLSSTPRKILLYIMNLYSSKNQKKMCLEKPFNFHFKINFNLNKVHFLYSRYTSRKNFRAEANKSIVCGTETIYSLVYTIGLPNARYTRAERMKRLTERNRRSIPRRRAPVYTDGGQHESSESAVEEKIAWSSKGVVAVYIHKTTACVQNNRHLLAAHLCFTTIALHSSVNISHPRIRKYKVRQSIIN